MLGTFRAGCSCPSCRQILLIPLFCVRCPCLGWHCQRAIDSACQPADLAQPLCAAADSQPWRGSESTQGSPSKGREQFGESSVEGLAKQRASEEKERVGAGTRVKSAFQRQKEYIEKS